MVLHRTVTLDDNEPEYFDVFWEDVRLARNKELEQSDWRFVSDRTPSQEWIDYRQFLRDLPQTYFDESDEITQGANAACDAWSSYPYPL